LGDITTFSYAYSGSAAETAVGAAIAQFVLAASSIAADDVELAERYSQNGMGYVNEAQASIQAEQTAAETGRQLLEEDLGEFRVEADMYIAEIRRSLDEATVYIQEAQVRIGAAKNFLQMATDVRQDWTTMEVLFDSEVRAFCGVDPIPGGGQQNA